LNAILRQLVDAARLAAGSLDLFPERIEVGRLVGQVAESLGRDPDHPPILWEGGDVQAFVDPERLRLVLEAFVEALVWWTNEGPLRVEGAVRDGRLLLEVSRRGSRLTQDEAERLFFARAPGTGSGSKIGLFVAHGVATAQGGTTSVRVGDAVTFVLDVPAEPTSRSV
jgi:K+-sensing histidine kinase KdpD